MARGRHPTRIHIDPPDAQTAAKYLYCWHGCDLFREPHRLPRLTSRELFGNDRPLEIDFGCGKGILACSRAGQYPEINVVGIDQSQKPLFCAVRDAAELKLENIKFVRGDFYAMLPLLQPGTVNKAYYLFPNPPHNIYLSRANVRRRLFLQGIHDALIPGGLFYFATDVPSYFECMYDILKNSIMFRTPDSANVDSGISTPYRQMWEQKGRPFRSIVVEKGI
ncbi:MAG: methyltransferase domain-containing protein [Deltaproteobacteria bacterium]|nr:methyltransferase domain-containing protein [Deltaproteobacteria bacterium]